MLRVSPRQSQVALALALVVMGATACKSDDDAALTEPTDTSKPKGDAGTSPDPTDPVETGDAGATVEPSAGANETADPCEAPTDTSLAALCLSFDPEAMGLIEPPSGEPGYLDGNGILMVEVFDNAEATGSPLATSVFPDQTTDPGVEVNITRLPALRFDDLPDTIFIRTQFIDNELILQTGEMLWGAFIGGNDLSQGFNDSDLKPVTLVPGAGTSIEQHLTALRYLQVNVTLAPGTAVLDDAQGSVVFAAYDTETPLATSNLMGVGVLGCADLSGGQVARVPGLVIGEGPHFLNVELDDFNLGGDPTGGSVLSAPFRIELSPTEYGREVDVVLEHVTPLGPNDPAAPAPFSCGG